MEEKPSSAVKTINAMKARQSFGQMLEEVYYRGEIYIVERAGKPMAALAPLSMLEEWQKHSGPAKTTHDTMKDTKRYTKKRRGRA
jgi:prevent-host-death family protein